MDSEDEARYTLYFDELVKVDPIDDDAEQREAFCTHMAAKEGVSVDDARAFVAKYEDHLSANLYDVRRGELVAAMVRMVDDDDAGTSTSGASEQADDAKVFREGFWKHPAGEALFDVMAMAPVPADYGDMSREELVKAVEKRDKHIADLTRQALSICGKYADMKLGVLKMTDHGWYNEKRANHLTYENEATRAIAQLKRSAAAEEEGRKTPLGSRTPSGRRTPAKQPRLE